jgi:hypothetical protein
MGLWVRPLPERIGVAKGTLGSATRCDLRDSWDL